MRDRSFNSWMQRVLFQNYEDWHMKEPNYNRNSFNIIGIDNTLKAMQDGYISYMELTPPQAIQGCTRMKAIVNKKKDGVDLYLDVDGKSYMIPALGYPEAVRILRNFVRSLKLPEGSRFIEIQRVDGKAIQADFRKLALLLLGESERTKRFLKKQKPDSIEAAEEAWNALYEEMLKQRRAVELEWKCDKEGFLMSVEKLCKGYQLVIREDGLHDAPGDIAGWCRELSAQWNDYCLAELDMFSETHGLFLLKREDCDEAVRLAENLLLTVKIYGSGEEARNV